ncbi:MAG: hypothetical protein KGJ79_17280 [Alphaproteobacteria bacterium]|nr:hypothetical protein [Alphaproteobacteria bacterium]MDE2112893.1 hypothetical protein [Alphaproteobacteria bacterium]MDE2495301.1 hypothetical protein [Alphaproteobacteria bacterium]
MRFVLGKQEEWSRFALKVVIGCIIGSLLTAIPHGIFEGHAYGSPADRAGWLTLATWCADLRYLFDQLIYAGVVLFVGAKFIETRSIFTIGFDKLDTDKVSISGPDEDNVDWIGRRYGTRLEAETVAATIENRLKESAG